MITLKRFRRLEAAVRVAGYADTIAWSEAIAAPATSRDFAEAAIYVVCNSGFRTSVALPVYQRCMVALDDGMSADTVFGHPGKTAAIDAIWLAKDTLFEAFNNDADKVTFCATLPWVGPVTKFHLAKNLGVDVAKSDVHLTRLARADGVTAQELCAALARATGYRIATIDTILWRACEAGILDSARYEKLGWYRAFTGRHTLPIPTEVSG